MIERYDITYVVIWHMLAQLRARRPPPAASTSIRSEGMGGPPRDELGELIPPRPPGQPVRDVGELLAPTAPNR